MDRFKLDQSKPIVFARRTLYQGTTYNRGDKVPEQDKLAKATVDKLFRGGFIKNGEVTVEEPKQEVAEPVAEVVPEEPAQEPKKRGRKTSKPKSE